jgi:hypothetical protein
MTNFVILESFTEIIRTFLNCVFFLQKKKLKAYNGSEEKYSPK